MNNVLYRSTVVALILVTLSVVTLVPASDDVTSPRSNVSDVTPADYLGRNVFEEAALVYAWASSVVERVPTEPVNNIYKWKKSRGRSVDGLTDSDDPVIVEAATVPNLLPIASMPSSMEGLTLRQGWVVGVQNISPPVGIDSVPFIMAEALNGEGGNSLGKSSWWRINTQRLRLRSTMQLPVDVKRHFLVTTWGTPFFNITSDAIYQQAPFSDAQIEKVEVVTLTLLAGQLVSKEYLVPITGSANFGRWVEVRSIDMEILTDLNNDGVINEDDREFVGIPYKDGATEEEIASGTEYMFVNDLLSNGASDREDTSMEHETEEDDDAEGIRIAFSLNKGKIWLEHPAIEALTFYTGKECYPDQKIEIKEEDPFDLAGESPLPETIYARADEDFEFPTDNPQSLGDLILKYLVPGGLGQPVIAGKVKLAVAEKIGADDHHKAMINYLDKHKVAHFTRRLTYSGDVFDKEIYYVAMKSAITELYGINARNGDLKGIDAVMKSSTWDSMTVIVNAGYNYDATSDAGFINKQRGEFFIRSHFNAATNTHWDQTCSAYVPGFSHFISNSLGSYMAASGYAANSTVDGSGGLVEGALIAHSVEPFSLISEIDIQDKKLLLVAVSDDRVNGNISVGSFHTDLRKGATSVNITHLDGGRNVALAVSKPGGGGMKCFIEGFTHKSTFPGLYIKTYLGFKVILPGTNP